MTPSAASPSRRRGSLSPENGLVSPVLSGSQGDEFPVLMKKVEGLIPESSLEEIREKRSVNQEDRNQVASSSVQTVGVQKAKRSFLQAAQKRVFSQQKFVVSEVDGCEKVIVPKEVFIGAKPIWEDFVIGKFLNAKSPHVGKIHMIVNKIWRLGDRSSLIDVFEVNESTVKFRIRNEGMRHRILNRGMWNIMDIPMIVSKWTPYAEEAQPAMKSIPLWITLTNVPPTMFTDKGLEFLASAVGKPIRLHPKTEACVSFDEAQILVEADLTKELRKEFVLTGEEEGELDSIVKYSFPWLPPRCSQCKKWGHLHTSCISVAINKDLESQKPESIPEASKIDIDSIEKETVSNLVTVSVVKDTDVVEHQEVVKEQTVDTAGGWSSPITGRTSPINNKKSLQYGEVSILSNAYSVLAIEDDGVEKTEEEKTEM